jgi:acyl-CoA hydrolase
MHLQHCSDKDSMTNSLLLVTASVDRIVLKKPLRADTDLKIAGAVTYVSRSSIDIQIEVTQLPPGANYSKAANNHIWEQSQIYSIGI